MKIIVYNTYNDIVIQFQDAYKAEIHTSYQCFKSGSVKNPYTPSVYGVGIIGNKYPISSTGNDKHTKEYNTWLDMVSRCYNKKLKEKYPTYKEAVCCEEWLLYDNFYEWLHSQENFDRWLNGDKWNIDKDIIVKGNKIYNPKNCCLVPHIVNCLFVKCDSIRGSLPIGVIKTEKDFGYHAKCRNPFTGKKDYLGNYQTIEKAFQAYKKHKEDIIKQVAEIEYKNGNITEECYRAMINYKVEITD